MGKELLLAIDQGTTGSTALVMDTAGATIGRATREFHQHFPAPGLVEHDADEIWQSVLDAVKDVPRPSVEVVPPESRVAPVTVVAVSESTMAAPWVADALV